MSALAVVLTPASGPLPAGNQEGSCGARVSMVLAAARIAATSGELLFSASLMPLAALPISL